MRRSRDAARYKLRAIGKNTWLLGQAFFIAVFLAGTLAMFNAVRRSLDLAAAEI